MRNPMTEIRIHGRGGQGNVVAAYLLATAAFAEGRFGQAFPAFGAERRGAPVTAFVRIADHPIRQRAQVRTPGFLIVQDEALLHVPDVTDGLLPGGGILVNSMRNPEELAARLEREVVVMPATTLATEHLGRPVPNTALLAGFLELTQMLPLDALITALAGRFQGEILERNTRLVHGAAERMPAGLWKETVYAGSA